MEAGFTKAYGTNACCWVQAPGRVNLIGEHTDYNDGFVLPCAINYQTIVAATPRDDRTVRVCALDYGSAIDELNLDQEIEFIEGKLWANYIRGVVKYLMQRGYALQGADLAVGGNVPQGAGLSSSASLEVAIGQLFKRLCGLTISQAEIALNGQQAENQFVGCNCGIMDQLISAQAQAQHALLIDCRSLECQPVSLPAGHSVLIINSNKQRGLVESEYNTRRAQCEAAAQFFGVAALRDVPWQHFIEREPDMEPITAKRARHVISENNRTLNAAQALASGDVQTLAKLMAESHASMRDDFEITVPEIDALVAIVKAVIGERGGVRMTGGGFGGCVVALLPDDLVDEVMAAVERDYPAQTGLQADCYLCQASAGAGDV